jgi:hypothetical protein
LIFVIRFEFVPFESFESVYKKQAAGQAFYSKVLNLDRFLRTGLFQRQISDERKNRVKRQGTESLTGLKIEQVKPCSPVKPFTGPVSCFSTLFCVLSEN